MGLLGLLNNTQCINLRTRQDLSKYSHGLIHKEIRYNILVNFNCIKIRHMKIMHMYTYFKWIQIEVGGARSEEPVNLLLGGQHRVSLLNLLHLNRDNQNTALKSSFTACPIVLVLSCRPRPRVQEGNVLNSKTDTGKLVKQHR